MLTAALALGLLTSCTNAQNETAMGQNETIENLKTRRSIRAYTEQMPPKELLEQVIEAGTYAPTGKGNQSPIIVAVTDKAMRDIFRSFLRSSGSTRSPGRQEISHLPV